MFAKVFTQIFDSSIAEDYMVRLVFMDMLVLCDRDGIVDMTPEAISRRTNVPFDAVTRAIDKLSRPDPRSRSHLEDGARIVLLDSHRNWGWQVVNYHHYRSIMDDESRRQYFRDKKRQYRELSKTVKDKVPLSKMSTQVEVEAEVDVEADKVKDSCAVAQSPVFQIPLNDRSCFDVSQGLITHSQQLYPAVDVEQEFRNMIGWLESDPSRRKTRRGVMRFVNGWLGRSQDRSRGNGNGNGTAKTATYETKREREYRLAHEFIQSRAASGGGPS